jgi:hypothetical protein
VSLCCAAVLCAVWGQALARAEKVGVRVAKGTQRKQLKATLKGLY